MKKGVSMVNRNVFRRKKVHGVGGPSRFWKKSIKKIMNLLFVGVFLSQKKRELYGQLRILKMWILKISPFGQDYSWGNFRKLTRKRKF